ncbi:MAG: DUF4320 family protein [Eubacteriales bacterium]|jgi:hypothetical protein
MKRKNSIVRETQPTATRRRHLKILKNEQGDIYFEFLICMILFVVIISVTLQVVSAVQLKFWLDRKTAAIVRHVQIRGEVDQIAEQMISEIEERLEGNVTIEWDAQFITGTWKVQLGDQVRLSVIGETILFSIGKSDVVKISLMSEMVGTCERYWKT